MNKPIPDHSGSELDALIAAYNQDLMNYYRKNASRILPLKEEAASPPAAPTAETTETPVPPAADFPAPVIVGPGRAEPSVSSPPVEKEEEGEIEEMFTALGTQELPSRLVPDAPPMDPAAQELPPEREPAAQAAAETPEEENFPAEEDRSGETDTGYIQVRTFTARQAVPVPGAVITITRKNGDKDELVRLMQTDISGLSPVVAVPTVSRELSLQPGTIPPFTSYSIQSDADGYYSVRNLNVPVYGGITAVQPVEMVPLPEQVSEGTLEFSESGPTELD